MHTRWVKIPNATTVAAAVARRHIELGGLLQELSDKDLAAPSLLPGWSRLTIACHLRFGAETNHAMTIAALEGNQVAFYPEGRAQQRPLTLVPRHDETPRDVIESLLSNADQLDTLWRTLSAEQWALGVQEPADNVDLGPTTLGMLALLRLTEVEVHGLDLDIGCGPWSELFVGTALRMRIQWLSTRRVNHTPADRTQDGNWVLRSSDGPVFSISLRGQEVVTTEGDGTGGGAEITGSQRDLLAFLLGRLELSELSVSGDNRLAESFSQAFPAP